MSLNVSLRLLRLGAENKYKSSLKIYIYISWSAHVDTVVSVGISLSEPAVKKYSNFLSGKRFN